ncbi:hypothetical protein DQ244_06130 [Blastococcus sp. TBT05-19]|uniref:hypothetical protein n=1 Tax=Blastococcus sp. TBT05-19 TaxID=2250581 RepID=UPI000DE94691|nr:hypothetical protein [Blastococcus sp. TBT05-19]RBY94836.1 hypothetical protein DQ244_06130 [Blastococcus sp. TBT05-19]
MTIAPQDHPHWVPETWAHLERRRAERRAAGISFRPDWITRQARRAAATRPGPASLHVEVGRYSAWLEGPDVGALLDAAGVTERLFDHDRGRWMVPVDRVDNVMSWAEWRERRIVTCSDVDR